MPDALRKRPSQHQAAQRLRRALVSEERVGKPIDGRGSHVVAVDAGARQYLGRAARQIPHEFRVARVQAEGCGDLRESSLDLLGPWNIPDQAFVLRVRCRDQGLERVARQLDERDLVEVRLAEHDTVPPERRLPRARIARPLACAVRGE